MYIAQLHALHAISNSLVVLLFCRTVSSAADPGCLSRILIFFPSQIRIYQQLKRGGEKYHQLSYHIENIFQNQEPVPYSTEKISVD